MKTVEKMILELAKFPKDAMCYAYEGEVTGLVIFTDAQNRSKSCLGYIPASESVAEDEGPAIFD